MHYPEMLDGLFLHVFKKEPPEQAARYESYMRAGAHCRIALEVYRYKRDVAGLVGRDAKQSRRGLIRGRLSPRAASCFT
jgi:hypothetical protein